MYVCAHPTCNSRRRWGVYIYYLLHRRGREQQRKQAIAARGSVQIHGIEPLKVTKRHANYTQTGKQKLEARHRPPPAPTTRNATAVGARVGVSPSRYTQQVRHLLFSFFIIVKVLHEQCLDAFTNFLLLFNAFRPMPPTRHLLQSHTRASGGSERVLLLRQQHHLHRRLILSN